MTPQKCPFCGSDVNIFGPSALWAGDYYVACHKRTCGLAGPFRTTETAAVRAWNQIRREQ